MLYYSYSNQMITGCKISNNFYMEIISEIYIIFPAHGWWDNYNSDMDNSLHYVQIWVAVRLVWGCIGIIPPPPPDTYSANLFPVWTVEIKFIEIKTIT